MRIAIFPALLSVLAVPALAQDPAPAQPSKTQVTLLAGTDYAEGQIAGQSYDTLSTSAGMTLSKGRFSLSASLPYLVTNAPANLIVSQGGLFGTPLFATPISQTTRVRRQGIGDVTVQAAYQLPTRDFDAVIAGAVKLPTASAQDGLGSGKTDYGISGQLSKRLGAVTPFVSAGYTVIGQPQGYAVHDTLSASAGARVILGRASGLSFDYAFAQSASDTIGDRQSVGVGLDTQLAPRLRLGLDGSTGLSADAPAMQVGLRVGLGF